jgi:hypothetical protein
MNLQLIVSNEWTLLPIVKTQGHEVFHKEYGGAIHGLVFIDEDGKGNAVVMDDQDSCLAMHEAPSQCFDSLKLACDRLFNELGLQAGAL